MVNPGDEKMSISDKALKNQLLEHFHKIFSVLKAMGNNKRLLILISLLDGPHSFRKLIVSSELQKTALSNHLKQLHDAKLIEKPDYGAYQISRDGISFLRNIYSSWQNSLSAQGDKLKLIQQRRNSNLFLNNFLSKK